MAGLLDDILKERDALSALAQRIEAEEPTMSDDTVAETYKEHNPQPYRDVAEQCQCDACKAYRKRVSDAQA